VGAGNEGRNLHYVVWSAYLTSDSCLHSLLHAPRDKDLISRLWDARKFPALANSCTKQCRSFTNFAFLHYQRHSILNGRPDWESRWWNKWFCDNWMNDRTFASNCRGWRPCRPSVSCSSTQRWDELSRRDDVGQVDHCHSQVMWWTEAAATPPLHNHHAHTTLLNSHSYSHKQSTIKTAKIGDICQTLGANSRPEKRITSPPQSHLERARRHPSRRESGHRESHWLQLDALFWLPNLPLPLRRSPPTSNTPIPRPTLLTTPNGIRIQSAVQTDRPTDRTTDRWDRRQTCTKRDYAHALWIVSDALKISL